jgi:hypothetical protein
MTEWLRSGKLDEDKSLMQTSDEFEPVGVGLIDVQAVFL